MEERLGGLGGLGEETREVVSWAGAAVVVDMEMEGKIVDQEFADLILLEILQQEQEVMRVVVRRGDVLKWP